MASISTKTIYTVELDISEVAAIELALSRFLRHYGNDQPTVAHSLQAAFKALLSTKTQLLEGPPVVPPPGEAPGTDESKTPPAVEGESR